MTGLFGWLTRTLDSSPAAALAASLLWGVLSIILSPCHLSSIPLIVGYIDGRGIRSTRRSFVVAALFSLGILLTIAAIGAITSLAGRLMGDIGPWGNILTAVVLLAVGLHFLGIISLPFLNPPATSNLKKGNLGTALVMGLVFGLAVGPCTFTYMAPVLALSFRIASDRPVFAGSLIAAYGLGHCLLIVLAGTFTGYVQKYLNWNERSKGAVILKKICGVLVLLGGLYFAWSALREFV